MEARYSIGFDLPWVWHPWQRK